MTDAIKWGPLLTGPEVAGLDLPSNTLVKDEVGIVATVRDWALSCSSPNYRLPADHPYYTKQPTLPEYGLKHTDGSRSGGQPPRTTLPEGVTPELVKRMLANTKSLATAIMCNAHGQQAEAKAILAEYEAATKTDPLVEAFDGLVTDPKKMAENLRVRLSKYGFSITQAPK